VRRQTQFEGAVGPPQFFMNREAELVCATRYPSILALLLLAACGGGDGGEAPAKSLTPNQPPAVVAPVGTRIIAAGEPVTLDLRGTFSYPDGDAIAIAAQFTPAIPGVAASGGVISGTPGTLGRIGVEAVATDGRGGSATEKFELLVVSSRRTRLTNPDLPATPFSYADVIGGLPAHLTSAAVAATDNTPVANPLSNAGIALGRVLFYDTRLSLLDNVACGSCHMQQFGFSDPASRSEGVSGGLTARHAMSLTDARFYARGRAFWDERAATIEDQALEPIQDTVEMGMTLPALEVKLAATSFYPALFQAAFGTPDVTSARIAAAIAQFVRAIVSTRSRFDRMREGTVTFTVQEQLGMSLFTTPLAGPGKSARCAGCHTTDAQVAFNVINNGLDAVPLDPGAGGGRFKSPSLRNIAVTAPYMHDGRFSTLEQVVEFYDSGIQFSADIATGLTDGAGQALRLGLSAEEKAALVAFLHTLTDPALLDDPRFSDPFPLP
jgi:cytochrome c peroxidase